MPVIDDRGYRWLGKSSPSNPTGQNQGAAGLLDRIRWCLQRTENLYLTLGVLKVESRSGVDQMAVIIPSRVKAAPANQYVILL